jgi:hypothetical protein
MQRLPIGAVLAHFSCERVEIPFLARTMPPQRRTPMSWSWSGPAGGKAGSFRVAVAHHRPNNRSASWYSASRSTSTPPPPAHAPMSRLTPESIRASQADLPPIGTVITELRRHDP